MSGNYLIDEYEYTTHAQKAERITVYTPMKCSEPGPFIVLLHDKMLDNVHAEKKLNQMKPLAKDLAQSGYAVMNVTYSDFNLEQQPEELENICTELYDIQNQFKKEFLDYYNGQTIIVGYGKGASLALMMAEHRENNKDLLVPDVVIAVAPTDSTYPEKFDEKTAICLIDGEADSDGTATKSREIYNSNNANADTKINLFVPRNTTYQMLIDPNVSAWKFVKEVIAAQTKSPAPQF